MNQVLFSSKSVDWETPKEFFDKYDRQFHFTLDVCATAENAKCKNFFTPEQDGLKQQWNGVCWMNPPYGRQIGEWVRKAWYEAQFGNTIVALLPARTDTKWFHQWIYLKRNVEVDFLKGRIKFNGHINAAPFPSMIVLFKRIV